MPPSIRRLDACLAAGALTLTAAALGSQLLSPSGARGATRPASVAAGLPVVFPAPGPQAATPRRGTPGQHARPAGSGARVQHLESRLRARMSHAKSGRYGLVADIEGVGRVAVHPRGAMRPASTQKLFTTLPSLLDQPGHRLTTTVSVHDRPTAGVLHGNLVVQAVADPSLLKRHLTGLAKQVRAAGIRRVTGHLRLDIGALPKHTRQPGWKRDFVPNDVGPLSPFPVYEDVWRHDAGYLAHPTGSNLRLFRDHLADQGVRIRGSSQVVRTSNAPLVVAIHRSAPLVDLVRHTLRVSDNFYAESLLTVAGGHARVHRLVGDAGITDKSVATDGSGLSYDDRESPRGEVQLLEYADAGPARDDLRRALPVACRKGTLKHRFCGTPAAGRVFAKTGTLDHTTALAGYTTDAAGRQVIFSVICAGVRSLSAAMRATDRAVLVLRNFGG